jgi:hypothetical protein
LDNNWNTIGFGVNRFRFDSYIYLFSKKTKESLGQESLSISLNALTNETESELKTSLRSGIEKVPIGVRNSNQK